LDPKQFMPLFGFEGEPQRVCLETQHDGGRSDILVETNRGIGIVEAKVDATDPIHQARRYAAKWTVLLTHRTSPRTPDRRVRYISWQQLAARLKELVRSSSPKLRMLSADLIAYLEEHRMIKQSHSVEVYAREINEPTTLNLFLKGRVYTCKYEASSRLAEALYFAPHF
jgi:hypothetical protein